MVFRFSWRITIICLLLAAAMVRLSFWQWDRHLQKIALIEHLEANLLEEPVALLKLSTEGDDWSDRIFRRVTVSGRYDFEHEVALRNRRHEGRAGVHVITPLQIDGSSQWVLVDRGFIPLGLDDRETRKKYQKPERVEIYGLVKETAPRARFSPANPETGEGKPWGDGWLRVDIEAMERQLPYGLLPIYLEVMPDPNDPNVLEKVVRESDGGRQDVLMYTGQAVKNFGLDAPEGSYPIPVHDTTTPPDIHLGYVYEWAFLAALTLAIGFIMQLGRFRRRRIPSDADTSDTEVPVERSAS